MRVLQVVDSESMLQLIETENPCHTSDTVGGNSQVTALSALLRQMANINLRHPQLCTHTLMPHPQAQRRPAAPPGATFLSRMPPSTP